MSVWLGTFCLTLAVCAAAVAAVLWTRAALTGRVEPGLAVLSVLPLAGAGGAVAVIETALVRHDFSVRFVAENGSRGTPPYYTITSLWAAHDGSLLLWVAILTGYVAVTGLMAVHRPGPLRSWAQVVMSAVATFFLAVALASDEVFGRVSPVPADGPGPNPLLQGHPAMGVHPPLLYTGLVGMVVPFAYGVAGMVTGTVDRRWWLAVRRATLVPWTALTAGIALGAWWSYSVLGWGGYWAWDPVENASLMPWLVATALLHSGMVQRRHGSLPAWNVGLALSTFLLASLGAFLTRSGVVGSVHAFAGSSVGPLLLGFLAATLVAVGCLAALRPGRLAEPAALRPGFSRGSALLVNNALLLFLAGVVLVGTLYPVLEQALTGGQVTVGAPFYDRFAIPLGLFLLAGMALGPVLRWRADDPQRVLGRMLPPLLVATAVVLVVAWSAGGTAATLTAFWLAALVAASAVQELLTATFRRRAGSRLGGLARHRGTTGALLAHVGVALCVSGIAATSSYGTVRESTLHTGQQVRVGHSALTLLGVTRHRSGDAMGTVARLRIGSPGGPGESVQPALRYYPQHDTTVASPAIVSGLRGDLYLTLLSVDQSARSATVRVALNPFVWMLWGGAAVIVAGGLLVVLPPRRRRPHRGAAEDEPEPEPVLEPVP